jgi:hypothetical protein
MLQATITLTIDLGEDETDILKDITGRRAAIEVGSYRLYGTVSIPDYVHPKGRDCRRTDEVLENYRRRAIEAEGEILSLSRGIIQAPLAMPGVVMPRVPVHKATPPDVPDLVDNISQCIHCHKLIKRVPGGQGPTWVHEDTGAVVG